MKKIFTLLLLFSVCIASTQAESNYREKTFDLFVSGNILQWEGLIDQMKTDPDFQSLENKEELLSYYYGLVGHLIDIKEKKHAREILDEALTIITPLVQQNPQNGRLAGLMANFQGYQIALSPLKATTLARSMLRYARNAEEMAPEDPEVNIWSANILFYMPDAFGGNTKQSKEYYCKALQLYDKDEDVPATHHYTRVGRGEKRKLPKGARIFQQGHGALPGVPTPEKCSLPPNSERTGRILIFKPT